MAEHDVRSRIPRTAGLQDRRDHLPPARLLGPHRSRAPVGVRRERQRHATPLLVPRSRRAEGHQAPARRRHLVAGRAQGDRIPARATRRRPRVGAPRARRRLTPCSLQTDDQIVDLLRSGQGVLNIVPLGPVVSDLATGAARRRTRRAVSPVRRRLAARRPRGRGAHHRRRGAPARVGALRAQLGAPVREAARLLHHRVGVRAAHVHARVGPRRQAGAGVHARLLPAGVRPLHRDHDAEPEARDEEEPQGAPAARAVPRRARSGCCTSATTCTCS